MRNYWGGGKNQVYELEIGIDNRYAPENTALKVFYRGETGEVIFLFLNESDMVVNCKVNVDGYETEIVTVNPNTANIETEDEAELADAEHYDEASMVNDVKRQPKAEVVPSQEKDESGKDETEASDEEGTVSKTEENTDEKNISGEGQEGRDDLTENESDEKEEGITETKGEETKTEDIKAEDTKTENTKEEEGKAEDTKEDNKEAGAVADKADPETEKAKEELNIPENDEINHENAKTEGELLGISRHTAALVTTSDDASLDNAEEMLTEPDDVSGPEEAFGEEEIKEAGTEPAEEEAVKPETEVAETENAETDDKENIQNQEAEEKKSDLVAEPDEIGTEDSGDGNITSSDENTVFPETETDTGKQETGAGEEENETSVDITEKVPEPEEIPEGIASPSDGADRKENDDTGNGEADEGETVLPGTDDDMDGQLLEDDSIEVLGKLDGKALEMVTVWESVNARAYRVAWEDIQEAIGEDRDALEDMDIPEGYPVNYTVLPSQAAALKEIFGWQKGKICILPWRRRMDISLPG